MALLEILYMINRLKKLTLLIQTNKFLKKRLKISLEKYLISVKKFKSKLAKVNFDERMEKASKDLVTKRYVENSLDLGDETIEKNEKT